MEWFLSDREITFLLFGLFAPAFELPSFNIALSLGNIELPQRRCGVREYTLR